MNDEVQQPGARTEGDPVAATKDSVRPTSIEQRRRRVAESLQVGNLGNNARDLPAQADPTHDCQIELIVEDIRPYEHNPRRANNVRFNEIKASIRASGLRNPFTVTRRPGDSHFVIEAGGNTRLLAIRQLWAETREPRFHKLGVLFRPWRSESHVLTAHLIENDQRGDMTFWDKAGGVVALKARLEAERGSALTLRPLEEEMKALGLSINTATLAHYLFATERLGTLGEVVTDLSGLDVKTMQPRLNAMKRYAQTCASLAETELYATVFEPVFRRTADEYRRTMNFSASAVCRACEDALADVLGEPVAQLRRALDPPGQTPQPSPDASPALAAANKGDQSAAIVPTMDGHASSADSAVSSANTGKPASRCRNDVSNAPQAKAGQAVIRSQVVEQVRLCAGLAGIGDCLRGDAAASLGYRMDALPIPDLGDALPEGRHRTWHLLTLISGQLDRPSSPAMPEAPAEGDSGAADSAPQALGDPPDSLPFDAAFLTWLVDAHDDTATACWSLLGLVRESRATSSTPVVPDSDVAATENA